MKFSEYLSNVYHEYGLDMSLADDIVNAMNNSMEMLTDCLKNVARNVLIDDVELYKHIPLRVIDIREGTYDIISLLTNKNHTETAFNIDTSNKSIDTLLKYWSGEIVDGNKITNKEKIDFLNLFRRYVQLSTEYEGINEDGEVVDFKAKMLSDKELFEGLHYLLDNNRIYLLSFLCNKNSGVEKITLEDIFIFNNYIYKLIGAFLGIPYTSILAKKEYREICLAFLKIALRGPTVKNINEAFKTTLSKNIPNVSDMYNASDEDKEHWETGALSPFDFIIHMPSIYQSDEFRYRLIETLINIIKPTYTHYYRIFFVEIPDEVFDIEDEVVLKYLEDLIQDIIEEINTKFICHHDADVLFDSGNTFDSGEGDLPLDGEGVELFEESIELTLEKNV